MVLPAPNDALLRLMIRFLAPLRDAFTAFLGGLGGAALAWLWFEDRPDIAGLLVLVPILAALYSTVRVTPGFVHSHPERAVALYDRMSWVYVALTAVVSAVAIVLLVKFAWVGEVNDEERKQTISALTAALTTFIGSLLVTTKETDDAIGAMVADRITPAFGQADPGEIRPPARYATRKGDKRWYLDVGSLGLRAANEDYFNAEGWGRAARRQRARDLESYLRPK